MKNYLNFELDIKDLETELDTLKDPYNNTGLSEVDTNKISKILYWKPEKTIEDMCRDAVSYTHLTLPTNREV